MILGGKKTEDGYVRRTNEEIYFTYGYRYGNTIHKTAVTRSDRKNNRRKGS